MFTTLRQQKTKHLNDKKNCYTTRQSVHQQQL